MRHILLFLWVSSVMAVAASVEGFEAPTYTVGNFAAQGAWLANGVEVVAEGALEGTQAVVLTSAPTSELHYGVEGNLPPEVRFIDLAIKPVAVAGEKIETAFNATGAQIAFARSATNTLELVLVNGESAEPKTVDTGNSLIESGETAKWVRLTARADAQTKKWDLFVNGRLAAINLDLDLAALGEVGIYGSEQAPTYLDAFSLGAENPLFADADSDGMPDAEEIANGTNPNANDRDWDLDNDGISNIEEMLRGSSPRLPTGSTLSLGNILYVDNLNGSDSNAGEVSYAAVGASGPKASLKAAMAAAKNGDLIVVLPGTGVYDEGSRGVDGKALTIKPVGSLTIK